MHQFIRHDTIFEFILNMSHIHIFCIWSIATLSNDKFNKYYFILHVLISRQTTYQQQLIV